MPSTFLYLLLFFSLHFHGISAVKAAIEYVYPNFSASNLFYFHTNGVFLTSQNGTFQAAIYKPGTQQSNYYFCVLHGPTQTVVWIANRNIPMSDRSSTVELTGEGLYANYPNGTALWSTPQFKTPVKLLRMLENGNLMILDAQNASLWRSFDHPSDALLSGQLLSVGAYLASSTSDMDYTESDYRLDVTSLDAILSWLGIPYWRLSNDKNSIKDRDATVAYLSMDDSGLSLETPSGATVIRITLQPAPLHILKLDSDGRLHITSYAVANSSVALSNAFVAPSSNCDLPLSCGSLGICSGQGNSSSCVCPPNFAFSTRPSGCAPVSTGNIFSANNSCNVTNDPNISYFYVGSDVTYFGNKFRSAAAMGENRSNCELLCTSNCTCSGYFYDSSSQSCFLLQQPIGSLISTNSSESDQNLGFLKIKNSNEKPSQTYDSSSPKILPVLLPSIAAFLSMLLVCGFGFVWWQRSQKKVRKSKSALTRIHGPPLKPISDSDCLFSENDDDMSDILIQGLPTRFTFQELEEVTGYFRNKIGSGGFGSVYKGELADSSLVAVKKIEGVGLQGRKEFCTEIAVIGNIHHINLVRLRGYCAQGSHRLLVYEYMNRGSLDRPLFRPTGQPLQWSERMHVAIGAARGLAYLHSGCQQKILHCDVKPENILLDDEGTKTQVKIADFGLAKLLTPEQSGLFTTMRGTRGYLAPEWLSNIPISDRTDVYSFGMVLLEIIHGRKNRSERVTDSDSNYYSSASTESASSKSDYFPLIALEKHEQRNYAELADSRLEGGVEMKELERMVKTALCCLHEDPGLRPNMTSVAAMLEGTMEVWEPRVEALGFLRVYGRGFSGSAMEIDNMTSRFGRSQDTTATNSVWPSYMSSNQLSGPR